MHIKIVVNSFPKSSETFLFNLVTGLEKRGIKVTVCATQKSKDTGFYAHRLKDWSGDIQYLPGKTNIIFRFLPVVRFIVAKPTLFIKLIRKWGFKKGAGIFLYVSYLLKGSPDIIHFSFSGIGITYIDCLQYLKKHLIKIIVSCRGTAEKVKPLLDPERAEKLKLLFSEVDLVHCVSKDMRNGLSFFNLPYEKAFINYPSIDLKNFKRTAMASGASNNINIVTTGNLNFSKGYIFALQAMKILKERGHKFTYHILGEGEDRPMITYAIHQFGLSNYVKLHGQVSSLKVFEQLNTADAFLLPSIYEGVSNAALEAMAMGIPLITTKAGGMEEVVQNRKNGMIVECFDGLAIANAIEEVLLSKELRSSLANNGRLTVENEFTLEKQIDIFVEQYKNILNVT